MGNFKKNPKRCYLASHEKVMETRFRNVDELENGQLVTRVVCEEVDILSPDSFPAIPSREEYSLENQIMAGVPLGMIPNTSHLLDPSDAATAEAIGAEIVENDMHTVVNEVNNQTTD